VDAVRSRVAGGREESMAEIRTAHLMTLALSVSGVQVGSRHALFEVL
jgi:hypothetical protein